MLVGLEVLGFGGRGWKQLTERLGQAGRELGLECHVETVSNVDDRVGFRINGPALAVLFVDDTPSVLVSASAATDAPRPYRS